MNHFICVQAAVQSTRLHASPHLDAIIGVGPSLGALELRLKLRGVLPPRALEFQAPADVP